MSVTAYLSAAANSSAAAYSTDAPYLSLAAYSSAEAPSTTACPITLAPAASGVAAVADPATVDALALSLHLLKCLVQFLCSYYIYAPSARRGGSSSYGVGLRIQASWVRILAPVTAKPSGVTGP